MLFATQRSALAPLPFSTCKNTKGADLRRSAEFSPIFTGYQVRRDKCRMLGWPIFASGAMTSAGNLVFRVLTRCLVGPLSGWRRRTYPVARTILMIELCFPHSNCAGGAARYAGMTQARHGNFDDTTEAGGTSMGLCSPGMLESSMTHAAPHHPVRRCLRTLQPLKPVRAATGS